MTLTTFLAMAASPEGGGSSSALVSFLPLVMIMVVFWFLIIRPQRKQQAKRKEMMAALKKGDRIVTNGGLFATIINVKDDRIVCTIADGIKVEIARNAVGGVID